jgi:hypothetical protein
MIEQNITSALVMEDDSDWDIRVKSQMEDFAKASRLLLQPMAGTSDRFVDPTYHSTAHAEAPINFDTRRSLTTPPLTSPYGDLDRWDLLWLGHCGANMPDSASQSIPLGRAVIFNDETVPETQHLEREWGDSQLMKQYPNHTRVVSRARGNTCTSAYALSLPGARKFFYELAIHRAGRAADIMFRNMCDGTDGRPRQICLSVQPQLFQHHRPIAAKGSMSDVGKPGEKKVVEYTAMAWTQNIRWSTMLNIPKLINGETDYIDLFQDGQPHPKLHYR